MLAIMAKRVGYWLGSCLGLPTPGLDLGEVFAFWVSLDAFVVLSGAVLTAYVGISGLLARMAKDRCLPQFILRKVCGGGGGVCTEVVLHAGSAFVFLRFSVPTPVCVFSLSTEE